jgi:hypothetical protein
MRLNLPLSLRQTPTYGRVSQVWVDREGAEGVALLSAPPAARVPVTDPKVERTYGALE